MSQKLWVPSCFLSSLEFRKCHRTSVWFYKSQQLISHAVTSCLLCSVQWHIKKERCKLKHRNFYFPIRKHVFTVSVYSLPRDVAKFLSLVTLQVQLYNTLINLLQPTLLWAGGLESTMPRGPSQFQRLCDSHYYQLKNCVCSRWWTFLNSLKHSSLLT